MFKKKMVVVLAVIFPFLAAAALLLYVGGNSEAVYTDECQRLKEAIQSNAFASVQRISSSYGDNATVNIRDETGTPLLFHASSLEMAEYLVRHFDADLGLSGADGETLLAYNIRKIQAGEAGRVSVLKYYLRLTSSPDGPGATGSVAVRQLARMKGCKGKEYPWDREMELLLEQPKSPLLAEHDYRFDHAIANPRVAISPPAGSGYEAGYRPGYEFFAADKEMVGNRLVLTYEGTIANPGVHISISTKDYGFESCLIRDADWLCRNLATGNNDVFAAPVVELATDATLAVEGAAPSYTTRASSKNLQPDGRIILGYEAQLAERLVVRVAYQNRFDFNSLKLRYGQWVGRLL